MKQELYKEYHLNPITMKDIPEVVDVPKKSEWNKTYHEKQKAT
jgi:hypothetical protein